ncbi:MAG: uroporphyrinogen-III synthase [Flavobacterium sp.]|nr:uroporphyrinogen-III synthase [Flavobacterium sp.]
MIRVLSTKKLQPNQRQFLLSAGIAVVEADFIAIKDCDFTFLKSNDNLIFTSQNAVKVVANHPEVQEIRRNPVFCVGEKTTDLLDSLGFTVQESAENASDLAKIIIDTYTAESFTFCCGNMRREELPELLKTANVNCNEIEVYQTEMLSNKINAILDGILFFSPSAVASYVTQNKINNETCFCIGKTTAKALENITGNIIIANQPSVENVIIQAINHYKKA